MIGPAQATLIERAQRSTVGAVSPKDYREMRAVRRLVARGVLEMWIGLPRVFRLVRR